MGLFFFMLRLNLRMSFDVLYFCFRLGILVIYAKLKEKEKNQLLRRKTLTFKYKKEKGREYIFIWQGSKCHLNSILYIIYMNIWLLMWIELLECSVNIIQSLNNFYLYPYKKKKERLNWGLVNLGNILQKIKL